MIRIGICDDEQAELQKVRGYVENWLDDRYDYSISCFNNPMELMSYTDKKGGFDLLLLDVYMPQLLGTEIAKELRKISLDYNCTIIGLCQLNRDATKTSGKPKLSMLRDSGEIEQSASKILFVWQDDDGYSLVLEKNRSGPTGYVPITYNKKNQVISEARP